MNSFLEQGIDIPQSPFDCIPYQHRTNIGLMRYLGNPTYFYSKIFNKITESQMGLGWKGS